MNPPVPARLTDQVKAGLVKLIEERGLGAGDKLPTAEQLCTMFGVSRTVIREAVASLTAEGLLWSRRGSGVFVTAAERPRTNSLSMQEPQDPGAVLEMMELRMSVEIEAAALAAERRTETHLLRMEATLRSVGKDALTVSGSSDADRIFHREIAIATGNSRFLMFIDDLGYLLIPRHVLDTSIGSESDRRDFLAVVHSEHYGIYQAIASRDSTGARAAMRAHLEQGRKRYREWSLVQWSGADQHSRSAAKEGAA
jgi:GntR family transcriptional regulator, transcriptional repressor for pyruvate dehydrogenase complex